MRKHRKDPAAVKAEGKCPWSDGQPCRTAKSCVMSAPESCVHLIQNRVGTCELCRKVNGPCGGTYLCFRDVQVAGG